jgi:serine/threonine-protein kinase HipA
VARPSKSRTLHAWMNGQYVGRWTNAANKSAQFAYASEWVGSDGARPLSLSMPLQGEFVYQGPVVDCYFENLLPDNDEIRRRIGSHVGARSDKAFDLLERIGRDCIGAVQLTAEREPPPNVHTIDATPIDEAGIEQLLMKTSGAPSFGSFEEDDDFRISLAGAQEKTALLNLNGRWMRPHNATPSTHILKLPLGQLHGGLDLRTSVENEWLCAQILNGYGVPTANCSIGRFGSQKALIVERFDRRLARDKSWILRLPQEDFCQVIGVAPAQKYEAHGGPGIDAIMNILLGSEVAEEDRKDFFRTQIIFWMLCAIDGHGKNFSLFLNAGGSYRLTPRYDVLSAFHAMGARSDQLSARAVKMAMGVRGSKAPHYLWNEILPRHFVHMAKRCGLGAEIRPMMDDLVKNTPAVIQSVQALLPPNFPEDLAGGIFRGLQAASDRIKS